MPSFKKALVNLKSNSFKKDGTRNLKSAKDLEIMGIEKNRVEEVWVCLILLVNGSEKEAKVIAKNIIESYL